MSTSQLLPGGPIEDRIGDLDTDCLRFPEIERCCGTNSETERSFMIDDLEPEDDQGRPVVKFTEAEWREKAEIEGNRTLIGRFSRWRPSLDSVRARIGYVLRLEGGVHIGSLNKQSIMLRFDLEADWCATNDSLIALVWIELPNLPLHLYDFDLISRICGPIGKAFDLDAATYRRSRPSVAKVRLEIDVTKTKFDRIWIEIVNEIGMVRGFWQRIEYGRVPKFCSKCRRFGHASCECRRLREGGKEQRRWEKVVVPVADPLSALLAEEETVERGVVSDGDAKPVEGDRNLELGQREAVVSPQSDGPGQRVDMGQENGPIEMSLTGVEPDFAQMAQEITEIAAMDHIHRTTEEIMQEEDSPSISFSVWAKGMKEKLGLEKGKVVDEAKNEDNKMREVERSPITPRGGRIGGVEGNTGSSSRVVKEIQKKKFDVEEWVIDLNKVWEEDEEMWNVMDDMFEELKKFLETHGGIKKYDIVGATEAAKILRRKIESSSVREKYGPSSSL
nr:TMV resistance protein N-like [Ipomoea batatas]